MFGVSGGLLKMFGIFLVWPIGFFFFLLLMVWFGFLSFCLCVYGTSVSRFLWDGHDTGKSDFNLQ